MASAQTLAKQSNALVTLYINEYQAKYDKAPQINRYRDRWGFQSMIEDLGYERAQEVIKYFFTTGRVGHPVKQLLNSYDRLDNILKEIAEDEVKRAELRAATERRVSEWRVNGNEGS